MQMNMEIDEALRLIYIVDAEAAQASDHLDRALGAGVSSLWLRQPGAGNSGSRPVTAKVAVPLWRNLSCLCLIRAASDGSRRWASRQYTRALICRRAKLI